MIARCLERHVKRIAPRGAHVALRVLTASRALSIAPTHPALQAGARAAARTFGRAPVFLRSGGTIPIATDFQSHGITPVLMGFALSDDGMHAPNEHFSIDRFLHAIECSIRFLAEAGHSTPPLHVRPTRLAHVDMQTGIHV
jgi:acetylornithine deacetylase/succinyl-diaminopimelate desuccinylase-like protein